MKKNYSFVLKFCGIVIIIFIMLTILSCSRKKNLYDDFTNSIWFYYNEKTDYYYELAFGRENIYFKDEFTNYGNDFKYYIKNDTILISNKQGEYLRNYKPVILYKNDTILVLRSIGLYDYKSIPTTDTLRKIINKIELNDIVFDSIRKEYEIRRWEMYRFNLDDDSMKLN